MGTFAACRGDGSDPPRDLGARCVGARDCDTGLCVDVDPESRICTIECAGDEGCPAGFGCARFSLSVEEDAGPVGEAVRACAPAADAGDAG